VESSLSHRLFGSQIKPGQHVDVGQLTVDLSRAAAILLFAYFFIRLQGLLASGAMAYLATGYGAWYLFEIVGFILVPSLLFAHGARTRKVGLLRIVAGWTVLGVVVNRLNVSVIAMNWDKTPHYVPSVMEMITTVTIITLGVLTFRWIVNRMPILHDDPRFAEAH
jgi:hypothetical protein